MIIATIEKETGELNREVSRVLREIDLICEYRNRLITEVVTGKLDVHDIELPMLDEVDDLEDWDEDPEVDEMTDTGEVTVDADD